MIDRLPLAGPIQSRTASTSKDSRIVNGIKEVRGDKKDVIKRPGYLVQTLTGATPSGKGQGLFSWNNYLVAAFGNSLYTIAGGVTSLLGSVTGGTNPFSFCSVTGDTKLAFHNGSNLYTINKGTPPTFIGGVGLSGVVSSVTINTAGGYYGYATSCVVSQTGGGTTTNIHAVAHGLVAGQGVQFSATTIPAGMVSGTTYQVVYVDVDNFTINTVTTGGGVGSPVVTTTAGVAVKYQASPTVTFETSPGTTATGTVTLFNHTVSGIVITVVGIGYLVVPTITFSAPPTGTTAVLTITEHRTFHSEYPPGQYQMTFDTPVNTIVSPGSGYFNPPTVSFPAFTFTPYVGVIPTGTTFLNTTGSVSTFTPTNTSSYLSTSYSEYSVSLATTASNVLMATVSAPPNTTALGTVVMASSGITGPFCPGLAYLNNTCYVMTYDGRVYNSAIDDPSSWSGTSLQASSDPDGGVALIRHLNYLVVFGQWSIEFFYDAGTATGSPLAVYQSGKLEMGCANGYSVASSEQTILWVGQSLTEGRSVYMLDGLSPVKVSTRYIEKYLNNDAMTNVIGYCFKIAGHSLYILSLKDQNITLVYDLDEKEWYQWSSQSGDTGVVNSGTETYFTPICYSGSLEYQPALYLQGENDGQLYKMDNVTTTDDVNKIYFRIVTPNVDSGTNKRKFYQRTELIGDKVTGSAYLRNSKDDYITWSTYRTFTMSAERAVLYQCGEARRRAWEVFISDAIPVRLEALEVEFDIGETAE